MNFRALAGLAFSYLWQRKLRTFLTVLGVVIGVGALTLLVGFGLGLQKSISDQMKFDDLMSLIIVYARDDSQLDPMEAEAVRKDRTPLNQETLGKIREIDGVVEAHPDINFRARLGFGGNEEIAIVSTMPSYADPAPVKALISTGGLFSAVDAREIIISDALHRRLMRETGQVNLVGKSITVTFPRQFAEIPEEGADASDTATGKVEVKIVGILTETGAEKKRLGLRLVHSRMALIPPELATRLWDVERVAGLDEAVIIENQGPMRVYPAIMVRVQSPKKAEAIKRSLQELKVDFLYIPDELAGQKLLLVIFTVILGVIGGISLVVASIGIINTLVMSILERTREIGIMRAIGASNGEMLKMVMIEGASIGLFGGLVGFGFSWAAGNVIDYFIAQGMSNPGGEPIHFFYFPPAFFFFTVGFATVVAWLSSLYPAWRATRVDPVEALRRE